MNLRLLPEAGEELRRLRELDRELGEKLDACLEMITIDPDELHAAAPGGLSKEYISELRKKNARVCRFKFEGLIPGLRILFFRGGETVFVTGIHDRDSLADYGLVREPVVRAYGYLLKQRRGAL